MGSRLEAAGHDVRYIPQSKPNIVREARKELDSEQLVCRHLEDDTAKSFEELVTKYDVDSPRSMAFPQMVYDHQYTTPDHQQFLLSGTNKPDYVAYLDLLHRLLDTFDRLYTSETTYVPLQFQGAELIRRTLQRVADYHGSRSVWVGFSPVPGHCSLYDDEDVCWRTFSSDYEVDMDEDERQRAVTYVENVREEKPAVNITHDYTDRSRLNQLRHQGRRIRRLASPNTDTREMLGRWFTLNARRLGRQLKGGVARRLYADRETSAEIINNRKYVFFPLQYYRESRITVRAPICYNLAWLVEYMSRSLPRGYDLVVKDHPQQLGALPLDTIRAIDRHSLTLAPSTNTHDVIANADAIVTINNTVGYEGIVHGKPVIALGKAFYSGSQYTYDPDTVEQLPSVLQEAVRSNGLTDQTVVEFVHRLLEGSYRGEWANPNEENVDMLADHVLTYLEQSQRNS